MERRDGSDRSRGFPFTAESGVWLNGAGTLVAADGQDGTVTLWDVATEKILATAQAHAGVAYSVGLSRNGRFLASAGQDAKINFWQLNGVHSHSVLSGHTGGIWGLAFSADGNQLVSGGDDGAMKVWESTTGVVLRTFLRDRLYERMDITGLTGVTLAQRDGLIALGAYDRSMSP